MWFSCFFKSWDEIFCHLRLCFNYSSWCKLSHQLCYVLNTGAELEPYGGEAGSQEMPQEPEAVDMHSLVWLYLP